MNHFNGIRWIFLNFYIKKVTEDKNYYDHTSGGDAFSSRFIMRSRKLVRILGKIIYYTISFIFYRVTKSIAPSGPSKRSISKKKK